MNDKSAADNREENLAKPEKLPEPTFWPITLSVGVVFFFWGFVTSLIISGLGLVVLGIALAGWIGELANE